MTIAATEACPRSGYSQLVYADRPRASARVIQSKMSRAANAGRPFSNFSGTYPENWSTNGTSRRARACQTLRHSSSWRTTQPLIAETKS